MHRDQRQNGAYVDAGKPPTQSLADAVVLVQNFGREDQADASAPPGVQDFKREKPDTLKRRAREAREARHPEGEKPSACAKGTCERTARANDPEGRGGRPLARLAWGGFGGESLQIGLKEAGGVASV